MSRPSRRWRPHPVAATRRRRSPLRAPGMLPVLVAGFALLFGMGSLEAAVPAFTDAEGTPALAGVLIAVWGVGSALGGLWFGVRRFAAPPVAQFRWALFACGIGMAPLAFVGETWLLGVVLLLGGAAIAPAITAQNGLVAGLAPEGALTEAFTWLTTVSYTAVAAGTAIGGTVVDRPGGVPAAFALGAAAALLAAAVVSWPFVGEYRGWGAGRREAGVRETS